MHWEIVDIEVGFVELNDNELIVMDEMVDVMGFYAAGDLLIAVSAQILW